MRIVYCSFILVIYFIGLINVTEAQLLKEVKTLPGTFTGKWLNTTTAIDSGDTLVFDMSQAVCNGYYLESPISVISDDSLNSVDFSMKYDNAKIVFDSIIECKPYLTAAANFNTSDSTLRFTSFSFVQNIEHNLQLATVRFNLLAGPVLASDFNSIIAYFNGDVCSYKFIDAVFPVAAITAGGSTIILPGDSVSLMANAGFGYSFLWSNGATTQTIQVFNTGTYTVTVTNTGGCSSNASLTVYVLAPLPVQVLDFHLEQVSDGVLVNWTTAGELNNDCFVVERSSNAMDWQEISTVNSSGNHNAISNYSITDNYPMYGMNYYRLKQTNYNGTYFCSEIKFCNYSGYEKNNLKLTAYPNPANSNIYAVVTENANLQLLSIDGDVIVAPINLEANSENQIDLKHVLPGVYILKVYNESNVITIKIVVTKQ